MKDTTQIQEGVRGLLPGGWSTLSDALAALLTLMAIGWAMSFQRQIGLDLYPQQFFAAMLALTLALAFLTLPFRSGTDRPKAPWYDVVLALISLIGVGYIAVRYPDLVLMIFSRPPELWIPSVLIVLLTLEALRRACGWALVIIIMAFLFYALFGDLFPGRLQGRAQNWQLLAGYMAVDSNGILGLPMSVATTIVVAFIFFGVLLGVPLGIYMGVSRFCKSFFDPMIELYRPVPPLAWAPLILTIFGIQDDGKIFLLFMVAFAIMVISARTGASGAQLSKIRASHSLGASDRQILRYVILPNALPEIMTGIRISIGVCWGTLVAAEMLAGTTGVGFIENVARTVSDYELIWVTILIMGSLGLVFDLMMRWVIGRLIPWRGKG